MLVQDYIAAIIIAFLAGLLATKFSIRMARKLKILDYPNKKRKLHKKPIPLLGGLGIFLSFSIVVLLYVYASDQLTGSHILNKYVWGIIIGGVILMIGGFLDDKYDLPPKLAIIAPLLSIVPIIISGIGINWVSNPLGEGIIHLDTYKSIVFWFEGLPYRITWLADIFTIVWLMGMMYTTKLLDGLDGLVSGMSGIAALFIFFISVFVVDESDVALLALIFAGCCFGFLVFNFNPAKVFLGEGGSLFPGFVLGVLSIISGSKVTITIMLLAIPILDVAWTIIRRLMEGHHPFKTSDKKHLHHRLLDAGFSQRKAVYLFWSLTFVIGVAVTILQGLGIEFLFLGMIVLIVFILLIAYLYKFKKEREKAHI